MNESRNEPPNSKLPRKKYTKPVLQVYGDFRDLTTMHGGMNADGAMGGHTA